MNPLPYLLVFTVICVVIAAACLYWQMKKDRRAMSQ